MLKMPQLKAATFVLREALPILGQLQRYWGMCSISQEDAGLARICQSSAGLLAERGLMCECTALRWQP